MLLHNLSTENNLHAVSLHEALLLYKSCINLAGELCREHWITFDMSKIFMGLFILLTTFLRFSLILCKISFGINISFKEEFTNKIVFCSVSFGLVLLPLINFLAGVSFLTFRCFVHIVCAVLSTLNCVAIVRNMSFLFFLFRKCIISLSLFENILSLLAFLFFLGSHFSNSYIISEYSIAHFVLCTFLITRLWMHQLSIIQNFNVKLGIFSVLLLCLRSLSFSIPYSIGLIIFISSGLKFYFIKMRKFTTERYYYLSLVSTFVSYILTILYHSEELHESDYISRIIFPRIIFLLFTIESIIFYFKSASSGIHMLFLFLSSGPLTILITGLQFSFCYLSACLFVFLLCLLNVYFPSNLKNIHMSFCDLICFWFLSIVLFFASGHDNNFSSLQITNSFIGFDEFNYYSSGFLLVVNTFIGDILTIVGIIILKRFNIISNHSIYTNYEFMVICLFNSWRLFFSCINVTVNRRHLMIWSVFAPKFTFDFAKTLFNVSLFGFSLAYNKFIGKTKIV